MYLYRTTADGLSGEISAGTLVPRLEEQFRQLFGYVPASSERRSWERSLPALVKEILAAALGQVEVLIEYVLPQTSKRVDAVLLGVSPRGDPSCVVIENKQWSRAELVDPEYLLVEIEGQGHRERLHPQEQVRRYVEYLRDFNKFLEAQPRSVTGLAFLYNATSANIAGLRGPEMDGLADYRMFAGDESAKLQRFLNRLSSASGAQVADDFLTAAIGPSKQLLQLVNEEIAGNPQFTLLDEQEVAYEIVLRAVERSKRGDQKEVIIVSGGPGTGKSVIAIALLAELAKRGLNVSHATGSRSFTTTLRQVVGRRVRRVQEVFRYFNVFAATEKNSLDVLIADEAHRIRTSSNYRFTPAAERSSLPQVDELIQAARVPLFLLDENQVVRPGEIGTVAVIEEAARRNGATVRKIDLNGQFRCGGSEAYITWVHRLLGLVDGGPQSWNAEDRFALQLADSPEHMEQVLAKRQADGYSARMSAGFCWPWSNPNPDGTLVNDVVIGGWRRPWNLRSDKPLEDVPSSSLWATDPAGFGQLGCIYTAQGFEYDYGGVIMGADLVWRQDHWESNVAACADRELRRAENFDELVRNVYKVLLTRGLLGCILYSVDSETNAFLRDLGVPPA